MVADLLRTIELISFGLLAVLVPIAIGLFVLCGGNLRDFGSGIGRKLGDQAHRGIGGRRERSGDENMPSSLIRSLSAVGDATVFRSARLICSSYFVRGRIYDESTKDACRHPWMSHR